MESRPVTRNNNNAIIYFELACIVEGRTLLIEGVSADETPRHDL